MMNINLKVTTYQYTDPYKGRFPYFLKGKVIDDNYYYRHEEIDQEIDDMISHIRSIGKGELDVEFHRFTGIFMVHFTQQSDLLLMKLML